ncbi:sulfite reductase subunit alpha [Tsukamurella sp. 8F]|uniref:sulfite reductase subunit alpha n=1 Tax=unclassified Tsukamurella TaxID=2633480 RepID=UPI0023B99AB4|nr:MULTISPECIES: sulfite reductase subunit alpha [unclassified Tsukamurella]MDF0530614.1 sulfite reductase subunit alpha [Tsukamurella sp. 8J]MDF0587815.1 sulfite reductase subunit alpha [Tsukamurella sp. 8F]
MTAVFPPELAVPFTSDQQSWLSGFLAGLAAAQRDDENSSGAATLTATVLYGTQTGNSEDLADRLLTALRAQGLGGTVAALDDATPDQLAASSHVLIVTSTYGEGEMPDNAELFWEALSSDGAPRLESLRFAVLALGDSGYEGFCQAGRLLDTRLEQLGAVRLAPRVDCDVDFEDPASAWITDVTERLAAEAPEVPGVPGTAAPSVAAPKPKRAKWNRKSPYPSRLVVNRLLSGADSAKEIRHFELDLGDSGIEYAAGDALGVLPVNSPALVDGVLEALGLEGTEEVDGGALRERLSTALEISTPAKDLLHAIAERDPASNLAAVLARGEREPLDHWLYGRDVLDLLQASPGCGFTAAEFTGLLRPLQPRAYSISSSPLASPDRIHLTVAAVRHGEPREHGGVASTFLADRASEATEVGIFLQPNASFRVPADDDRPMIMVGPGTGIAPFRAFLHERAGRGATGRNWLFFGDQHRASDFIYSDELTEFADRGLLHRMDLAFSRDQTEKVYVQTKMEEHGAELYAWLEDGGHFYVCGDASRMAKDVDDALRRIVADARGRGSDDADEYVATLKREKRYVRDVY